MESLWTRTQTQEMSATYFDQDNRPVGVQQPAVYDDDIEADDSRARRELIARLLLHMIRGEADCERIGRRVLLAAFFARCPGAPRNQRELARRLQVSDAAISRAVKLFRRELAQMGS